MDREIPVFICIGMFLLLPKHDKDNGHQGEEGKGVQYLLLASILQLFFIQVPLPSPMQSFVSGYPFQ